MHRRLSEQRIRATCRELIAGNSELSGRGLCKELRLRFGAVGKTERTFQIWREEMAEAEQKTKTAALGTWPPGERDTYIRELEKRLELAEARAGELEKMQALRSSPAESAALVEIKRRLAFAEKTAAENLARAELAELREMAHQEKWAIEVDRLRQEVIALRTSATRSR